jgi:hypothetical protein
MFLNYSKIFQVFLEKLTGKGEIRKLAGEVCFKNERFGLKI